MTPDGHPHCPPSMGQMADTVSSLMFWVQISLLSQSVTAQTTGWTAAWGVTLQCRFYSHYLHSSEIVQGEPIFTCESNCCRWTAWEKISTRATSYSTFRKLDNLSLENITNEFGQLIIGKMARRVGITMSPVAFFVHPPERFSNDTGGRG